MSEFEKLWGRAAVPHEIRVEKEACNKDPQVVSRPRPDTNGLMGRMELPKEVRRLTRMFVQGQRRRESKYIEGDTGETTVMLWRRTTVEGRITPKKDSHVGKRERYWDDRWVPGSVLRAMGNSKEGQTEFYELDSGDGVKEEVVDWVSLEMVNGGFLRPPTIASMINPQLLQQLQKLTI